MFKKRSKTEPLPADHPGTFIEEEIESRGWAQADLAYILGMDGTQLNKLIKGHSDITPDTAVALGEAFDVSPDFFLNLQRMHDLQKARKADPGVRTRASWVSVFPVREMLKRGWIEDARADLLDLQMMRFFGKNRIEDIPFVSDAPVLAHAAKRTGYEDLTATQYVWLNRVRKIAESAPDCPRYSRAALIASLNSIRAHMLDPRDVSEIPKILWDCGVRLVLTQGLPASKIDGVCVWIADQPVIGLTLRLDRLDNFCFVVRHEIEHVLAEDGRAWAEAFAPVDELGENIDRSDDQPECEIKANDAAAEFCVPQELLRSFLVRKSPFISEKDVLAFAARVEINPAIVIGQIQNKTHNYAWLRKYQTGVKEYLMDWKLKDGWGVQAPTGL